MNEDEVLVMIIKRGKTAYLDHVTHSTRYRLPQMITEDKIEGKRGIGSKETSWLK